MAHPAAPAHTRTDTAVLITDAAPSYAEQYAWRRRKYATIMALRLPCLALAGVFYQTWWLALAFIALSVPLPWIAVLIANDRPPRRAEDAHRLRPVAPHQMESRSHRILGVGQP